MRIPLMLSERAVRDAKAYMANPDPEHAVESLIDSYGNLVGDLRKLRSRVRQLRRRVRRTGRSYQQAARGSSIDR